MASKFAFPKAFNSDEATRALYKNWREGFVLPLLIGALIFGAVILISAVSSAENIALNSVFIAVYVIIAVVTFIRFPYQIRIGAFLLSVYVISVSELLRYNIFGDSNIFFLALIALATMLLSPRAGMAATALIMITCIVFGYLMLNGDVKALSAIAEAKLADWISGTAVILLFGAVIILGFQRLEKEFVESQKQTSLALNELEKQRGSLEDKVAERTTKLRRVNEIGRLITSILDPDELLARAARLIGDEFECYYAAVFLLDVTERWAELKEATGDAGKILRENKYRVDVKGKNLVGAALRMRQARTAQDTGDNPVRFDNPLLPYTRSQIVIPLAIGERVIGALELQSKQENAFLQQDAETYQNMANEIAVAFENARLFKEAQQSLAEMRATQRQYLQNAWSSTAAEQRLEYSLGENETGKNQIAIPLTLRDQIIGQIEMTTKEDLPLEQKNLIAAIATQAALALENARLVEESQSIAARERLASEITAKVWASTSMNGILQTTARELGRALEAAEIVIELNANQKDDADETKDKVQ